MSTVEGSDKSTATSKATIVIGADNPTLRITPMKLDEKNFLFWSAATEL